MRDDQAELAARHLDVARRAAALYHARVGAYLDYDELFAMASVGLTEAARRYDPSAGTTFPQYAWYRVQGAIVDGVRRACNLPRDVWVQLAALRASAEYLEAQAVRGTAARDRGATRTTLDRLREVQAALGAVRTMYVVALDDVVAARLASDDHVPADERLGRERQRARLAAAIERLPERERALVHKHYVEGKTLLDAGAELGLSKSWASRLHARAVDQLRALLADTS